MARKWVIGLIALLIAVTMGGIGYAQFTSSVSLSVNASAGTVALSWIDSTPTLTGCPAYATCSASLTAGALSMTCGPLAPGDSCTLPQSDGVYLENSGSLPATVSLAFVSQTGPGCFQFADNLFFSSNPAITNPFTYTFPIGASDTGNLPGAYGVPLTGDTPLTGAYTATITLPADAPNSCQGATDTASWSITASG